MAIAKHWNLKAASRSELIFIMLIRHAMIELTVSTFTAHVNRSRVAIKDKIFPSHVLGILKNDEPHKI